MTPKSATSFKPTLRESMSEKDQSSLQVPYHYKGHPNSRKWV